MGSAETAPRCGVTRPAGRQISDAVSCRCALDPDADERHHVEPAVDDDLRQGIERSVLSTLLHDPARVRGSRDRGIQCEHFVRPSHRALYRALLGGGVDLPRADGTAAFDDRLPLIAAALDRAGLLDAIGGLEALAEIHDAAGSAEFADRYATELIEIDAKERRRALHERAARGDSSAEDELRGLDERGTRARVAGAAVLVSLASVEARPIAWLWPGRIPLGKLTVLDGDPGLGKSSVTLDLAARVTTGRPMPDGSYCGASGAVLLLTYEDDLADTVRPRFDAAGGDAECVFGFTISTPDGERMPELPRDLDALESAIRQRGAVLVVVDPLMAALAGEVNAHRDQDVRRALSPLSKVAERTGAAVLVVRHLNKGGAAGSNPLYRGGGSIGIIGAARSGLLVARDPRDVERRVLAVTKANLAAPAPALVFRTLTSGFGLAIEWLGIAECSTDELLAPAGDRGERTAIGEARAFLLGALRNGPQPSKTVTCEAKEAGICDRTLDRARRALSIASRKQGFGKGAPWVWELPDGAHSRHAVSYSPRPTKGENGEYGAAAGVAALEALGIRDPRAGE